jgi:hypothetical protein
MALSELGEIRRRRGDFGGALDAESADDRGRGGHQLI